MATTADSTTRVGIEVCSDRLQAAVISGSNEITHTRTVAINDGDDRVAALCRLAGAMKAESGANSLGVAVPGLVDRRSGKVAFSAQMPEHAGLDLVKVIEDGCQSTAYLENDANAAAYGEFKLGAGRDARNLFYATLGEGVGGAFILNGEIWRGASGYAGEFGYVPINSEGMKLEEVASSANILRRTRARFHTDSTSSLNKLSEEAITLEKIINAASEDDDFAQMMLERTGNYVGTAIASVINLLNPERIVVGGSIMAAKDTVLNAIASRAGELAFEPAYSATTILAGELGDYAAAVGAALLAHADQDR